MVFIH